MKIVATILALIMVIIPVSVQADVYPAQSRAIVGDGMNSLEIAGEPDDHGLVWQIKEPARTFENWTVLVYNAGDAPVSNIIATLEIQIDGKWYLANTDAKERVIHPGTILPGEFGFQQFGGIMANPTPWDDARINVDSINEDDETPVQSLLVDNFEYSSGSFAGTIGGSDVHMTHLTLFIGCVRDGQVEEVIWFVSDLLKLPAGESESFEFTERMGAECPDDTDSHIAIAAGRK